MAIKIGRKQVVSAKKEFTDRDEPRKDFWKRFYTMKSDGSTIITYYGTGGVGKTSLMKKLQENIEGFSEGQDIAFVRVDFKDKLTTLELLQTIMRPQLEEYGCNFPLFSTGEFSYFLKTGQKSKHDAKEIESTIDKNKWLSQVKKNWAKPAAIIDFFLPGVNAVATGISIIGNALIKYWEDEKILDDEHREIKARLDELQSDKTNPYEVYELLPELFAQDVKDWLKSDKTEKNYLVVFLDTYEALTNEESALARQLNAESWLRSETGNPTGIIFLLENTLWVISGRNKLHWDGLLADELEQHKLEPLAQHDADRFLQTAGVVNQELRDYIYNLTQGLPFFLELCVELYVTHKRDHNGADPDKSDFGKKREDVVERFFQYMDDGTRDMIKFLCGLGTWTDKLAFEIGTKTFNFSQTTYERIKELSFIIREDDFQINDMRVENFSTTIFSLDRTVQKILFPSCAKIVIEKTFTVADEYFSKVLDESEVDGEYLFNLKYWAKLTARLATSPDDLRKHYEKNFSVELTLLNTIVSWFDIVENILKIFVEEFIDKESRFKDFQDSVAFAYFEREFGDLKNSQGLYQDAYNYHNDAYEKFFRLLGEEHEDTLNAMKTLATDLNNLGRYDEALTWNEKVFALTKNKFGEDDDKTITAMGSLADTLNNLGRYDEALKIQEQIVSWCEKNFDKNDENSLNKDAYLLAMNALAGTLGNLGRYDEASELQEKIIELIEDEDSLDSTIIAVINDRAVTLSDFGRYEEALELKEEVLDWNKKIISD
ncbi:MAG: tetratricopeptide repeat protein [Selenomonadaceae bacterium]|nr:tetratricopeptide repeat protein [Selenomonadaceae bacterium]